MYSDAAETVIHSADAFAPVGYLRFTEMHTESKDGVSQTSEATIHECNLFSKYNQHHSMLNQSFYSKSSSCCMVDCFLSPLRAKEIQEQNLSVSNNFVEQKRYMALRGRVQINLQRASIFLSRSVPHTCSQSIYSSHSSSPTWPTLTSAIFTAA